MKVIFAICTIFALAAAQDGSGSGEQPAVTVTIPFGFKVTLDADFPTVVGSDEASFKTAFCADMTNQTEAALNSLNLNYETVVCDVKQLTSGSIIVDFTLDVTGQSNEISASNAAELQAQLDLLTAVNGQAILAGTGFEDVNECTDANFASCLAFQQCNNLVGTYECNCADNKFDENGDASSCIDPITVTCEANGMTINIVPGYLVANSILASDLRLVDEDCSGVDNGAADATITVTGLTTCNTTKAESTTHITYSNTISNEPKSTDIIETGATIGATVSCQYEIGVTTSLDSFEGSVSTINNVNVTENGTFSVVLASFTDNTFVTPETKTQFQTTETLYIQAALDSLDAGLNLKFTRCYATQTNNLTALPQYDLIDNSCEVDQAVEGTVNIMQSGTSPNGQFSVQVFRFVGDSDTVYIHCEMEICDGNCAPDCVSSARRRRSAGSSIVTSLKRQRRQAVVGANAVGDDTETLGPIFRVVVESEGLDTIVIILISILIVVLLTVMFVILFLVLRRRRDKEDKRSSYAFNGEKNGHVNTSYDY